ncbi:MAG: hypothetical protein ACBR12_18215 [Microcoleus sp.]
MINQNFKIIDNNFKILIFNLKDAPFSIEPLQTHPSTVDITKTHNTKVVCKIPSPIYRQNPQTKPINIPLSTVFIQE